MNTLVVPRAAWVLILLGISSSSFAAERPSPKSLPARDYVTEILKLDEQMTRHPTDRRLLKKMIAIHELMLKRELDAVPPAEPPPPTAPTPAGSVEFLLSTDEPPVGLLKPSKPMSSILP